MGSENCNALIMTLGGAPEPLAFSIGCLKPDAVLFFASEESRKKIDEVRQILESQGGKWPTKIEMAIIPDPQDYASGFNKMSYKIPRWLDKHSLLASQVAIDATGGTKPMTASLMLYSASRFKKFVYVGGIRRNKDNIGTVITGSEQLIWFDNPEIITFDAALQRWHRYSALSRYETIADEAVELQERILKSSREALICEFLTGIFRVLSDYDRFDWKKQLKDSYFKCLGRMQEIAAVFGSVELKKWFNELDALKTHFEELTQSGDRKGVVWVYALLANAKRRAGCEKKYEDAVATLYSAFERLSQMRVKEKFGYETSKFPFNSVPASLKSEYVSRFANGAPEGHMKFGLDASMKLLAEADDPVGRNYIAPDGIWLDGQKSPLKRRNDSIRGHGMNPIREDDYQNLWGEMISLWGIDEAQLPVIPILPERISLD